MTVGSLFAGIGGFDLGFTRAGFDVKWQVEIDPFCRAVLAKHWPNARRYEDVCTVGAELGYVDVICGGFPCQDISPAGARVGIDGARSGLWREFARLVGDLRPRYVVVENSADLLIRGISRVVGDLAALGYDAEWEVVSACALGAPHTRERVFLVAYPASERPRQLWRRWSAEEREGTRHLYWPTDEPDCERVVDGVPDRAQRLIAVGNSIIPHIAEWIAARILEVEATMTDSRSLKQNPDQQPLAPGQPAILDELHKCKLHRPSPSMSCHDQPLVSSLRDCVAVLEAIIGRREPGFAIEEILDAAIAALNQADGKPDV